MQVGCARRLSARTSRAHAHPWPLAPWRCARRVPRPHRPTDARGPARNRADSEYFDSLDRNMVKMPACKEGEDTKTTSCGAYKLFTNEEYQELRKAGRIETGAVDVMRPEGS